MSTTTTTTTIQNEKLHIHVKQQRRSASTLCRVCRVFNTQNNWEIVLVMLFVCIIVYSVYQIHLAKFIQLNCFNPQVFFVFFYYSRFLFRFFAIISLWLVSHIRHTQSGAQHSNKWIRGIYCSSFSINCVEIFEPDTRTDTFWYSLCTIISMKTIHFQFCWGIFFFSCVAGGRWTHESERTLTIRFSEMKAFHCIHNFLILEMV